MLVSGVQANWTAGLAAPTKTVNGSSNSCAVDGCTFSPQKACLCSKHWQEICSRCDSISELIIAISELEDELQLGVIVESASKLKRSLTMQVFAGITFNTHNQLLHVAAGACGKFEWGKITGPGLARSAGDRLTYYL